MRLLVARGTAVVVMSAHAADGAHIAWALDGEPEERPGAWNSAIPRSGLIVTHFMLFLRQLQGFPYTSVLKFLFFNTDGGARDQRGDGFLSPSSKPMMGL